MLKKFMLFVIALTLLVIVFIIVANNSITKNASGKLYSATSLTPYNKVGLLLGTSRHVNNGQINAYYAYRIDAAVQLLQDGKIKYLVISGDNSRKEYNEPLDMKNDLISRGIDSNKIFLDYAGFRTFDSVVRLKEIFEQGAVTIISQRFHNERALFIANKEGIDAIGFNAKDVSAYYGFKTNAREKLARCKAYIDYLVGAKPKYLGDKVHIY